MASSLSNVLVHIVFATKLRQPFLQHLSSRVAMHRYLANVSGRLACPTVAVGGVADHVHILARQARTITMAEWVKELKRVSSLWAKGVAPDLADFQWQEGYGAFSVSQSLSSEVQMYIEQQAQHHQTSDFQNEMRTLFAHHEIAYDERYVWD